MEVVLYQQLVIKYFQILKTTSLNDGYYGIDPTGTAPQKIN